MDALDLLIIFALLGVTAVAIATGRRHASAGGAERRLSVAIPEGELLMALRPATTITASRWREIQTAATAMAAALHAPHGKKPQALDVHALGPLIVRRKGVEIVGWGGAKAGTRQALALFAFLLDRGERGAHKEEMVELVWPDVDIDRADLAFHRTLNGLRTVLSGPLPASRREQITVRDGVYRLNMALVSWFDVDAFDEHLSAIEASNSLAAMEEHLDAARRLYRGDYMDDCPFFGDSSQVETRRQLLRDRYVGALRTVAEARERRGSRAAAGQLFREALSVSGSTVVDEAQGPRLVHPAA